MIVSVKLSRDLFHKKQIPAKPILPSLCRDIILFRKFFRSILRIRIKLRYSEREAVYLCMMPSAYLRICSLVHYE